MTDNELAAFIRARREAVTPADVGLPEGARRRTPGLRRSELATLAGISVEYLTRLEQGRDRHPSGQVLTALACALRLTAEERIRLRQAAKAASGDRLNCPGASPPIREVRPTVLALLDGLEPAPAVVVNRLADVLAYTSGYRRLAGPLGVLDGERPNLARHLFTDPRARDAYPDWDEAATEQVAALQAGAPPEDPHLAGLAGTIGAAFAARLAAPAPTPRRTGVQRLVHPELGELRLAYESLGLAADDVLRLLVYLPADAGTAAALDRAAGRRPGALRVVAG
ncbi:transcriptional regulator [Sphaerisporangium rufum]|uniref:Transcriptional regulator n=1 Tax=Sphaerisporangium rufum TaxID=1381558 RepID=A0A919R4Y2_9ACTN|nr:helix-turn-helix domain-containing protein [Sphaerisporangium rufum]GII79772.1 transcriptional regulator [Sphaerisporangium rufum]